MYVLETSFNESSFHGETGYERITGTNRMESGINHHYTRWMSSVHGRKLQL